MNEKWSEKEEQALYGLSKRGESDERIVCHLKSLFPLSQCLFTLGSVKKKRQRLGVKKRRGGNK